MSGGTFNVSRSIWTHPAFSDEPFTEREAFLWMVGEASWKPREVRVGSYVARTERGQLAASVRFMAEAWRWSKSRVDRFLKRLEKRDTIRTESGTGILVITIRDYNDFQSKASDGGTEAGQSAGQKRDRSGTNEKKDNQDKKEETPLPPKGGEAPSRQHDPFIAFWAAYPRRVERKGAEKKFRAAVKSGVDPGRIIAAARRYAESDAVRRGYAKHPTTWLNNGCWDDEPEPQPQRGPDERPRKRSGLAAALDDARRADERRAAERNGADGADRRDVVELFSAERGPGGGPARSGDVEGCAVRPAGGGDQPGHSEAGPFPVAFAAYPWRN